MKIDAHQHFWKYSATEYGWIDDQMSIIRRDFLPSALEREIRDAGVDCVVSVQARQTLEETLWLLSVAAQNDFVKGVVGCEATVDYELSATWFKMSRTVICCARISTPAYRSCRKWD